MKHLPRQEEVEEDKLRCCIVFVLKQKFTQHQLPYLKLSIFQFVFDRIHSILYPLPLYFIHTDLLESVVR